jgi:hypothetical protein
MRRYQRRRRQLTPSLVRLLAPIVRYSYGRDGYVLRGIGRRFGPVLKGRSDKDRASKR